MSEKKLSPKRKKGGAMAMNASRWRVTLPAVFLHLYRSHDQFCGKQHL